jgi:hypothetical protein
MKIDLRFATRFVLLTFLGTVPALAAPRDTSRVNVRLITDEADAVLSILDARRRGEPITDSAWGRLFASEGYVRLKKRETAFKLPFDDSVFQSFVLSDSLAHRSDDLAATLARWKTMDMGAASGRALAYLPADAVITAKIYPVIKPKTNSFVFEVRTDPAIFLYLDPTVTGEKFENTVAHELHHIGYGTACPSKEAAEAIDGLPQSVKNVVDWIGAFGEGLAMLAAAGGPDVHPHAVSPQEERRHWDRDMMDLNADLRKVERFFLDVLDDRLTKEEREETAYSFFDIQGPWYTVGWKMAALIEKTYGRPALIDITCDCRNLLGTYNRAAVQYNRAGGDTLALWPARLVEALVPIDGK